MSIREEVKVGAHMWAYAATQPKGDVYNILDRIFEDFSNTDFDGIELMVNVFLLHNDSYEKISGLSSRYKVPIIGSSFEANMYDKNTHEQILKDAEKILSILAKLEARNFGVTTGNAGRKKTSDELNVQAEVLVKIKKMCENNGIVMNLHNHTWEVTDDEYELKENIKRIPDVKLGPDLNWLLRAGVEPFDFLRRYREKIVYMHIRDQKGSRWVEALGEGDFDLSLFREVLEEIGFSGDVAIELAYEKDHKFIRSIGENFKLSCYNLKKALGFYSKRT